MASSVVRDLGVLQSIWSHQEQLSWGCTIGLAFASRVLYEYEDDRVSVALLYGVSIAFTVAASCDLRLCWQYITRLAILNALLVTVLLIVALRSQLQDLNAQISYAPIFIVIFLSVLSKERAGTIPHSHARRRIKSRSLNSGEEPLSEDGLAGPLYDRKVKYDQLETVTSAQLTTDNLYLLHRDLLPVTVCHANGGPSTRSHILQSQAMTDIELGTESVSTDPLIRAYMETIEGKSSKVLEKVPSQITSLQPEPSLDLSTIPDFAR
ncbi:MAG: hypothetical protein M1818_001612 [Claussenomyces sp. TS43310]|nr:MAG: hypothetical protein M1818_001612 [Claussenomyces sp. TS43310]